MANSTTRDDLLYFAVLEHIRTWLGGDGPLVEALKKNRGKLDKYALRRIARNYNVSRGIGAKGKAGDIHAKALVKLLNDALPWPRDLVARAKCCEKLARKARKHTHGNVQFSLVTKLSWFAQPDGWTMYDRYARKAIGAREGLTSTRSLRNVAFRSTPSKSKEYLTAKPCFICMARVCLTSC